MSDPGLNLIQRAAHLLAEFLAWVGESLSSDEARRAVLADLGLPNQGTAQAPVLDQHIDSIELYRQKSNADFEAFQSAWGDLVACLETLDAMVQAAGAGGREAAQEATYQLLSLLATDFMRLRYPFWYFLSRLLLVIEEKYPEQFFGTITSTPGTIWHLFELLGDPVEHLKQAFTEPATADDAVALSQRTLLPLAVLLAFWEKTGRSVVHLLGADVELPERTLIYGWEHTPNTPTPLGDEISRRVLSFEFEGKLTDPPKEGGGSVTGKLGATMAWVPREHGGPGLFVTLHGSDEVAAPLSDNWKLKLKFSSADAADFLIWDGVDASGPADASAALTVETTRKDDAEPYVFAIAKGTRLEIGKFSVSGQLGSSGASIKAVAKKSALLLTVSDGDAFVEDAVPSQEVRFEFDLGIGLDSARGLFLEGGSGMELALAVNRSYGPVRLQQIYMKLDSGSSGKGVHFEASFALQLKLGPITAVIDRIGFNVVGDSKNRDAPIIGYKGPQGVGLLIDSAPVSGAGYLFFDPDAGMYGGTVQLDIKGLALQAVGMITTRMPDGSRGFSLLIILTVTHFKPVNLGFGFRLTAVGGLVGFRRTANVDAMRAGLKAGALDAILFPKNPVADAPRILSTLQTIMPPRKGQFIAGPVGRIEWGVPTVLTIELGILLELPSPTRLLILGQLFALLPTEKKALLQLRMDALGVVDFDRNEISIDAVLYDSRILAYTLTGDMALRARFGNNPTFLLAVGGFHPKFTPPAGFPKLERTALTLNKGDSARLRFESYYAITSNTAQVGAHLELLVRAGGFSVDGHMGFDALFQFSPFSFIVEIKAGVTLKWHGHTLLGVDLEFTLSGPSPWHAHGKATFKIWRFSKSVSFDHSFGDDAPPPALPSADPLPELLQALRDPRSWSSRLPPASASLVTLRNQPGVDGVLVHPLGELSVRQRVVPLGITIERFGNTTPSGDRSFTLQVLDQHGNPTNSAPVLDHFAAGQFLELSDSERLRRPSFELMEAGRSFGGGLSFGGETDASLIGVSDMDYETVPSFEDDKPTPLQHTVAELQAVIAIDRSRPTLRRTGETKYRAPGLGVGIVKARYAVVSTSDLQPVALPELTGSAPSYTAAAQALWRHVAGRPDLQDELQVITVFEEVRAGQ